MMHLNSSTIATIVLVALGGMVATPVLAKGFNRRGTGVKYEQNFLIQRAPQLVSIMNVAFIVFAFLAYNGILDSSDKLVPVLTLTTTPPHGVTSLIAWAGVLLLLSGLIFMIGGWYSLGECFSTDAEVLDSHTVKNSGLLRYVMHPAYSGIIQSLVGASLACTSVFCALFAIFLVAPLWLRRAKYEEKILLESLGPSYREYAENMKWRRLVPRFFPIGV
jgi:protein-S-isoprenylcysteine O-methyltransferase Ste14